METMVHHDGDRVRLPQPLLAAALCFAGASAPGAQQQEFDVYWAERWNNAYHRFTDANGDGIRTTSRSPNGSTSSRPSP